MATFAAPRSASAGKYCCKRTFWDNTAQAADLLELDSHTGFYYYKPNVPLAWIGVAGFALLASIHMGLFVRRQAWHFWCMYIGLLSTFDPVLREKEQY